MGENPFGELAHLCEGNAFMHYLSDRTIGRESNGTLHWAKCGSSIERIRPEMIAQDGQAAEVGTDSLQNALTALLTQD